MAKGKKVPNKYLYRGFEPAANVLTNRRTHVDEVLSTHRIAYPAGSGFPFDSERMPKVQQGRSVWWMEKLVYRLLA